MGLKNKEMNIMDKWQIRCLSAMANTSYPEGKVNTPQETIYERGRDFKVKVILNDFYDLIESKMNNEN